MASFHLSHKKYKDREYHMDTRGVEFYTASVCAASTSFVAGRVEGGYRSDQSIPCGGMDFHWQQGGRPDTGQRSPARHLGADPFLSLRHLQRLP
jgi:hypothetical protein